MTATDGIGRIDVLAIVNALFARLTPIRAINVLLEPGSTFSTGRTTFVDSGLVGGSVFFYRISALVPEGESNLFAFDGISVLSDTRGPAAPAFRTRGRTILNSWAFRWPD